VKHRNWKPNPADFPFFLQGGHGCQDSSRAGPLSRGASDLIEIDDVDPQAAPSCPHIPDEWIPVECTFETRPFLSQRMPHW